MEFWLFRMEIQDVKVEALSNCFKRKSAENEWEYFKFKNDPCKIRILCYIYQEKK